MRLAISPYALHHAMDCRVKPGNDDVEITAATRAGKMNAIAD
jgi:hypothetical protein